MEEEEPMKIAIIAILSSLLLLGCTAKPQRIEISAEPISKPNLILPPIEALRLKDVEWIIITKDNYKEVFAELEKGRKDQVLIGLTDDGYKVLSTNMSDIMTLISQQNQIIAAYQNYYEKSEQALDDANSTIEGTKEQAESQQSQPSESIIGKLNPFK